MDEPSRKAFLGGIGRDGVRTFHAYMRDALRADAIYNRVAHALVTQFRGLPMFTIFGERNDPLGFQPRWKELLPRAQLVVVSKGNHFPMCDNPNLVAMSIRELHRESRRSE